jgi:hypothetical protein
MPGSRGKRRVPSKRNPEAKALSGGAFRQRVIKDKRAKSKAKRLADEVRKADAGPENERGD